MKASSSQTKKTFHARSNRGVVDIKNVLIVAFFLLAVSAVGIFFFSTTISNVVFRIAEPVWRIQQTAGAWFSDAGLTLKQKHTFEQENQNLKRRIAELNTEILTLRLRAEETERLKTLLGREETPRTGTLAAVLKRPPASPYDTFIIDRGGARGISVGDIVLVHDTIPIGEVREVHTRTAKVVLFSSPGAQMRVMIGDARIQATAEGLGGGTFSTQLPQGVSISVGDIIILPEMRNQPFAIVEQVETKPADPFQIIYFKNPVNLAELSWVYIAETN